MAQAVLTTFDPDLGAIVGAELQRHGVRVICDTVVERIEPVTDGGLRVLGRPDLDVTADAVLVAVGVRPDSNLASATGITVDRRRDDRRRRTNGHRHRRHLGRRRLRAHPPRAHPATDVSATRDRPQAGRVAGINAAGGDARFAGSLGTQAVKILGLVAARTGFGDREATAAGYDPVSTTVEVDDHKAYYPGATTIHVRITGDCRDDRLLGAQLIGAYGAEISKRVDIVATAIHNHRTVASLSDLDLSYTPPLSSPGTPCRPPPSLVARQPTITLPIRNLTARRLTPQFIDYRQSSMNHSCDIAWTRTVAR